MFSVLQSPGTTAVAVEVYFLSPIGNRARALRLSSLGGQGYLARGLDKEEKKTSSTTFHNVVRDSIIQHLLYCQEKYSTCCIFYDMHNKAIAVFVQFIQQMLYNKNYDY